LLAKCIGEMHFNQMGASSINSPGESAIFTFDFGFYFTFWPSPLYSSIDWYIYDIYKCLCHEQIKSLFQLCHVCFDIAIGGGKNNNANCNAQPKEKQNINFLANFSRLKRRPKARIRNTEREIRKQSKNTII